MGRHKKTEERLSAAIEVLEENYPMTLRGVYYQLVTRQVIKNNRSTYQAISKLLVEARKDGTIPWEWLEDRIRQPRQVQMWDDLSDYTETIKYAYRRDIWQDQPQLVECWLEKDALSGIFEGVLRPYRVMLNTARGYDGWSNTREASERYYGEDVILLYFGDFDPSGEDMVRDLKERFNFFGCDFELIKCALTLDDIDRYNLPPDFAKKTDTRTPAFVAKYGDISVELDALPKSVLQERIVSEVEKYMDLDALQKSKNKEETERATLIAQLESI